MAQTTPLAPTTSAANSSDISVSTMAKLVMFASTPPIRERCVMVVQTKDPNGNYAELKDEKGFPVKITTREPDYIVVGPGTYRIVKSPTNTAIGCYADA